MRKEAIDFIREFAHESGSISSHYRVLILGPSIYEINRFITNHKLHRCYTAGGNEFGWNNYVMGDTYKDVKLVIELPGWRDGKSETFLDCADRLFNLLEPIKISES